MHSAPLCLKPRHGPRVRETGASLQPFVLITLDVVASRPPASYDKFTVMEELRFYLESLLDHRCSSTLNCPECLSLQRIYQFMQTEIFSTVVYTETAIEHRVPARFEPRPAHRAAAGPRRPHAA